MSWRVQGARFVMYLVGSEQPDAQDVWDAILQPRKAQSVQRSAEGVPPTSVATGNLRGQQLFISVQTGRIDLYVGPQVPPFGRSETVELDEALKTTLDASVFYGRKCAVKYRPWRVAIVLDAFKDATDFRHAATLLQEALDFLPQVDSVRDANFQVNIVKPFPGQGAREMNRVCQWATMSVQTFNIPTPTPEVRVAITGNQLQPMVTVNHILNFQMDLSSDQSSTSPLDVGNALSMLDALGSEARRLLAEGFRGLVS